MTKLYYLATSLERVKALKTASHLVGFTAFPTIEPVIEHIQSGAFKEEDPFVGKLELPDEVQTAPTQAKTGLFTQIGYDPLTKDAKAKEYRQTLYRHHLSRISVVPWNDMPHDISEKARAMAAISHKADEVTDYQLVHHPIDSVMQEEADRTESFGLGLSLADLLKGYEDLRKKFGLTHDEEMRFSGAKGVLLAFYMQMFDAEERRYEKLYLNAQSDEEKVKFFKAAQDAAERSAIFTQLQEAEVVKIAQRSGALRNLDIDPTILEIGSDDIADISDGKTSLPVLEQAQMTIDRRQ